MEVWKAEDAIAVPQMMSDQGNSRQGAESPESKVPASAQQDEEHLSCAQIEPPAEDPKVFQTSERQQETVFPVYGVGTRIRIRSQAEGNHKLENYANTEAFVVEVPVHPNTWVGVELWDGSQVKIRKSAFDIVGAESAENAEPRRKPVRRRVSKRKFSTSSDSSGSHHCKRYLVGSTVMIEAGDHRGNIGLVVRGGNGYYCVKLTNTGTHVMKRSHDLRVVSKKRSRRNSYHVEGRATVVTPEPIPRLLVQKESWMNRCVYVKSGKFEGEVGVVRRSGHGFYGVDIAGRGEVMKRAAELQLCEEEGDVEEEEDVVVKKKARRDAGVDMAAEILLEIQQQQDGWSEVASPARAFVMEQTRQEMEKRRGGDTPGWTTSSKWRPPVDTVVPQTAVPAFVMRVNDLNESNLLSVSNLQVQQFYGLVPETAFVGHLPFNSLTPLPPTFTTC